MDQPVPQSESPYESSRRVNNVLRLGTIVEVRHAAPARCRVQTGDNATDWLPWITHRAGGQSGGATWWPPVVGEQVLLLAPGGDLAQAVVLPGVYSDQLPQADHTPGACRIDFSTTDHLDYQPGRHLRLQFGTTVLQLSADAITLHAAGGTATLDVQGLRGEPDVITGAVSLRAHRHTEVDKGSDISGPPA